MKKNAEERIEEAFLELYQERYFDKISVKDICVKAGLSRATFYIYYEDTKSLLKEIETRVMENHQIIFEAWLYLDLQNYRWDKPIPIFVNLYRYIEEHKQLFKALFGKYASNNFIMKWNEKIEKSIYEKINQDQIFVDNIEFLVSYIAGGVQRASVAWIHGNIPLESKEMALLMTKFMLRAMYDRKG